ncbi:MAG: hypothetical protein FD122_3564 [Stygiobacter sp.]|nr:MAG: hypothetical protein FD122_3564 [Stygiobacter sp.]
MNIIVGYLTPDSGNISIDCEVMSGQTYCSIEACLLNAQNDHLWSVQLRFSLIRLQFYGCKRDGYNAIAYIYSHF